MYYTEIMRYTHSFRIIKKKRHTLKISLVLSGLLFVLVLVLGFTELDARMFIGGFIESVMRVLVAYILSLILAITATLFVTSSQKIEDLSIPILDALQSFPAFAMVPLLIIWLGKSNLVVIVVLTIEMIWPILFTILSSKKQLRADLLEAAVSFGARGWKYLVFVLMPLMFPAVVTGSIVAWGEAWETIIAAEIIVGVPGIGSYLSSSGESFQSTVLVVGVIMLLLILFVLNKLIWLPLLNLSTRYQSDA